MPELLFNICIISGCWNPMPIEPCGGGVCEYTRMLGFGMPPIFGTTPLIRVACGCCYTYSSMAARQVINTLLLTIGFIAPILLPDVVRVCRAAIDDGIWPCTGCVLIGPTVIWPLPIEGCIVLCGTVASALYRLKTFLLTRTCPIGTGEAAGCGVNRPCVDGWTTPRDPVPTTGTTLATM